MKTKIIGKQKHASQAILLAIILVIAAGCANPQMVTLYYNAAIPQHEFAAKDILHSLELKEIPYEVKALSSLSEDQPGVKIILSNKSDAGILDLLSSEGGEAVPELGEQAFALRTTSAADVSYWVLGGDDNGAMYGGLELAENISFYGLKETYNDEQSPFLADRGVKFNIPLDKEAPTYFYNHGGTSHKLAIKNVWDMDFWETWFDEMARHRYNVLSLWSPHPFTSMVNMEDQYPGIAINGVEGYDLQGNIIQVNDLSIDEKIEFWKDVMKYGKERGFKIFFCTWNIFLSTAEGKHGLTDKADNEKTRAYFRECVRQFFETYPDLTGLGITVGERMGGMTNMEKEEWAWDAYGRGLIEYAEANPERDIVFIHRQHQGDLSDILEYFQPLVDIPNVRFDLSFKYSKAHAHSTPTPAYWDRVGMEAGLRPNDLKSWLTIRNDDWYFLHWADPHYVRDYVKNFPEPGTFVNSVYIGADGWVFTKEFVSKDPYYIDRDALEIERTWYFQKIWGRIFYNPEISDEVFKKHLALRFPEVSSEDLFTAWTDASGAILLANEQVTGTWNLDFKWWPEGWTSKDGFRTLEETRKVTPMPGSERCSFENTARKECGSELSAFSTADKIQKKADNALDILGEFNPGSNKELELTVKNLTAMCYLSLYNAHKFRAAIYLEQEKRQEALDAISIAYCQWRKYTEFMDELFYGVDLQRNLDFTDWHVYDDDALKDYLDLGGKGEPLCPNE
jgi:hypothetical protein